MDWWATASLYYLYLIVGLVYAAVLYLTICDLAACFQRWCNRGAAERLLDSVPDVPYLPVPGQPASSCVICIAEYRRGEGRFVMPGCGHVFHRGCIAEWLRQGKITCPICRATAIVVVGPPPAAGEEDVAAGVGVSTAEDMV